MTRFYRAQVAVENDSLEVRDAAVNTYHFAADEVDAQSTEVATIVSSLTALYQSLDGPVLSVHGSGNFRIKVYDLEDAPVRAPIHDSTWAGSMGTTALPNEVAVCVSFRGANISGGNRRRRRGRVFLGPVSTNLNDSRVGDQEVASADRTIILNAFASLGTALNGGLSNIAHCVFSKANALGLAVGEAPPELEPTYTPEQLEAGMTGVSLYWVDNALDTQRRRGLRPTTRTTINPGV